MQKQQTTAEHYYNKKGAENTNRWSKSNKNSTPKNKNDIIWIFSSNNFAELKI